MNIPGINPQQLLGQMVGNNPMASMLMQGMQGGMDPSKMLAQMAQQNPQMKQLLPLIQGKNGSQINQTAANLCKEQGVDFNQMAQQAMQQFGQFMPK